MYAANYKILLKEIKDPNKQRSIPFLWTGELNITKMAIFLKLIFRFWVTNLKSSTWNKLVPLFISFNENSRNEQPRVDGSSTMSSGTSLFLPLLRKQNKTSKQKTNVVSDTVPWTRDSCFLAIIILEIHKGRRGRKKANL